MSLDFLHPQPGRPMLTGLIDALLHWSATRPDEPAAIILGDGENETARASYRELATSAQALAGRLTAEGLAGHPVLLPAQTGIEFVRGFFGAALAGSVIVPVSAQARGAAADRLRAISGDCGAEAILDAPGAAAIGEVLPGARLISMAEDGADPTPAPPSDGGRVALLQYTSGSTSTPRGVAITADAMAYNAEMVRRAFPVREHSKMLSWLPLFHDMGLMAMMMPIWVGVPTILMPPLTFLQRPPRWPMAVARYGATVSGGPNFAYDLCSARAETALGAGIDLSGWELAFCGSEPVRRATLRRFADAYRPAGFEASALYPCYGLAEATVYVSGGHWNPEVTEGPVSCGPIAEGTEVRIVPVEVDGAPAADDGTGEIWISGPQVGLEYWNNPEATAETFGSELPDAPGRRWLRTGDVGAIREGELYVLGRTKDMMIHRGANIHAADVELSAAACHPAFADAPGAAFGVERDDRETVVLVHEVGRRFTKPDDLNALKIAVEDRLALDHGLRLAELVIVRPGTLPRTASGKVRRAEARRVYLEGGFEHRRVGATAGSDPALETEAS